MPKYNPSDDELAGYDNAAPVTPPDSAPAGPEESVDRENEEGNTAVISNKILSPDGEPIKEGDEIVVRVVKNYGDESEIEYAPKEGGKAAAATETEEPMSQEATELAALSEGKA